MDTHFKIITSFYNVETWIRATVNSVLLQTYADFECILTDDMSTDKSSEYINELIKEDSRFTLVQNKEKSTALANNVNAIERSKPSDQDAIIILDGDDWLASPLSLEILNNAYKFKKCWMTYGSYIEYPNGRRGDFCKQVPKSVVEENSFRDIPWVFSHLKTFKYALWKQIKGDDLIDPKTGKHFTKTQDLAFMYPMLEMSGHNTTFIDEVLCVYNLANPLNDHKVDHTEQLRIESHIRGKQRYLPIKEL
jgi:glycosyltransferase involved in cell wall biosynthesis